MRERDAVRVCALYERQCDGLRESSVHHDSACLLGCGRKRACAWAGLGAGALLPVMQSVNLDA